jgi:drug/metabolite transporter (DMT)-like permease
MDRKKIIFLLVAITGVFFFALTGVSVAERSFIGAILSLVASILVIGYGFTLKKKWRESEE